MNSPAVYLAASAAAAVAAVTPVVVDNPGYTVQVMLGVLAGTIWRARYWFTDKGFQPKACISDFSAMGALVIGGFGICDYWAISGWTAGTVAVFASVIGVEPIRQTAIAAMDLWAKSRASALGGGGSNTNGGGQP